MPRSEKRVPKSTEYTDEFLMSSYKVIPCGRKYPHDWASCPCGHKGERAARRDLRTYSYVAVACSYAKQKLPCPNGDACPWAHNLFEYWLHPSRYRTEVCQYGTSCERPVCFFAHSLEELRGLDAALPPAELCWSAGAATAHGGAGAGASGAGRSARAGASAGGGGSGGAAGAVAAAIAQQQAAGAALVMREPMVGGLGGQVPQMSQGLGLNDPLLAQLQMVQQQHQQQQHQQALSGAVGLAGSGGLSHLAALQAQEAAWMLPPGDDAAAATLAAMSSGASFTACAPPPMSLEDYLSPTSVLGALPALDRGASRQSSFSQGPLPPVALSTAVRSSSFTSAMAQLSAGMRTGSFTSQQPSVRSASFTNGMPLQSRLGEGWQPSLLAGHGGMHPLAEMDLTGAHSEELEQLPPAAAHYMTQQQFGVQQAQQQQQQQRQQPGSLRGLGGLANLLNSLRLHTQL